jgi:hypothetical protein
LQHPRLIDERACAQLNSNQLECGVLTQTANKPKQSLSTTNGAQTCSAWLAALCGLMVGYIAHSTRLARRLAILGLILANIASTTSNGANCIRIRPVKQRNVSHQLQ